MRGEVGDASVLQAVDSAGGSVTEGTAIQLRADGGAAVEGPHTVIRETAAENETVAAAVDQHDTTGNGLPDENVAGMYDLLFEADQEAAAAVLSRSADGEITSARLILSVWSSRSVQTIAVILLFLTGLFWVRYRSWSHGALILAPVVISLTWLLGTMALLDIPFNSETAVITSLAIGLGVDYSIHAGERFMEEREHRETLDAAVQSTITGTGGALLASAATTAAGFGVLALALSPPLQRFGIVTASAILSAFLAVVTILPGLLVLRERVLSGEVR